MKSVCKKSLALLLTLILVVSLLGGAYALEEESATVTVASGAPDESGAVSLAVGIANNPGFAAFNLEVSCGDALTLTGVTGGLCSPEVNGNYLGFASAENITGNGTLFTLHFITTDPYDAATGATVSLALGGVQGGCFANVDQTAVDVTFVSGTVGSDPRSGEAYEWYHDGEPYTITTAAELAAFADLVNNTDEDFADSTVTLAGDIDLSGYGEWTPIGTAGKAFAGTFDGKDHTISGLTITDATGGYKGLFGNVAGTVQDFAVSGSIGSAASPIASGFDNIGGAVGYNAGTVSGVIANVDIYVNTNTIYAIGGVVGQNDGTIENCGNIGDITGTKCVGGIVGRSYGTVTCCYNSGAITGNGALKDAIGGIAGQTGNKATTVDAAIPTSVTYCYNTGAISNPSGRWYGGIAGFASQWTTLTNCYTTGQTGSNGYTSDWNPLVGTVDSYDGEVANYTFSNNYSLSGLNGCDTEGSATYAFTVGTVKTESELKDAAFLTAINGATTNFKADSTVQPINSGYPVLFWQETVEPTGFQVTLANNTAAGATITGITGGSTYSGSVTFNVTCGNACVVAYTTDGGATYTRLTAAANANGGYDFTVNVTGAMEIVVALKGDANLNGTVNGADALLAQRATAGAVTQSSLQKLATDVNGNGTVNGADALLIQRLTAGATTFSW